MTAFWDIIGKASNLLQLFGLDAVTLVTIALSFLPLHEADKERRKLEERVRMLRVLLLSPACCLIMVHHPQQYLVITSELRDAQGLVDSYNGSTLFRRVRRGRSMTRQFRDLRGRVGSHCRLILFVNAFLLVVQANQPPPSTSFVRAEGNDDGGVPPSTGDSIDAPATSTTAAPDDSTHTIDISQE